LPVSKLIELPPISRETRLTPSFIAVLSAASGWRHF
jgi:hypothetical protein